MFDKLKALSTVAALLKDKDKISQATQRVKQLSADLRCMGEGGGGSVRVTCNGQMKLIAVELAPTLAAGMAADNRTRELAGNLIIEATDKAQAIAKERMTEIIRKEAKALGLPDTPEGLQTLLGG